MARCKTPGKLAYPNWMAATQAVIKHKGDRVLMPYKCPSCHKWHLSSHSQRPARRR